MKYLFIALLLFSSLAWGESDTLEFKGSEDVPLFTADERYWKASDYIICVDSETTGFSVNGAVFSVKEGDVITIASPDAHGIRKVTIERSGK